MNTIYWLAVTGMSFGYFLFFFSIFSIWFTYKTGSLQERMIIEYSFGNGSWSRMVKWKALYVAIFCTVVFFTI